MITLTYAGTTLDLYLGHPLWRDEHDWQPVVQRGEYSLAGSLILESGVKQAGRPITLEGDERCAWMRYAVLAQLQQWAAVPGRIMSLLLRGIARDAVFDHEGEAIVARPLSYYSDPQPEHFFIVTLRFLEV